MNDFERDDKMTQIQAVDQVREIYWNA